MRIHAANPGRFGPRTWRIEVDDLRSRVDARVSATRGNDARGCIGNRVYTELTDNELYVMVPGAEITSIAEQLQTILAANATLTDYHAKRRAELMRT